MKNNIPHVVRSVEYFALRYFVFHFINSEKTAGCIPIFISDKTRTAGQFNLDARQTRAINAETEMEKASV